MIKNSQTNFFFLLRIRLRPEKEHCVKKSKSLIQEIERSPEYVEFGREIVPDMIVFEIMRYLEFRDLLELMRVSKGFYGAIGAKDDRFGLWKEMYGKSGGCLELEEEEGNWKEKCEEMSRNRMDVLMLVGREGRVEYVFDGKILGTKVKSPYIKDRVIRVFPYYGVFLLG
eukprot:TRINITY_DN25731_c0_g1_i1.p1 TRINITY_DN25731_c0_g1~~TRINITY_DN25731_c0_g1_i1.p1  ORF type:complete len:170 (-),score=37.04 TRINITY_DN25731_c0_g1_i1:106-615(-)